MGTVSCTELVKKGRLLLSMAATVRLASLCMESSKQDKKGLSASLLSAARRKMAHTPRKHSLFISRKGPGFMSLFFFQFSRPAIASIQSNSVGIRGERETSFLEVSVKLRCSS